jgi:hypothetical protein
MEGQHLATFEVNRQLTVSAAYNRVLSLRNIAQSVGAMPRSPQEVRGIPSQQGTIGALGGMLSQTQAEIAVLALWQPIAQLYDLVYSHAAIGTTLNPFVSTESQDRNVWLHDLRALEQEFSTEVRGTDHPDLETKIAGWERRVQHLIDVIPPEARRWHIIAAIAEQIPFLFVAGGTAMRVGTWVSRVTSGSRLLMALAEGTVMTIFQAAGTARAARAVPRRRSAGRARWSRTWPGRASAASCSRRAETSPVGSPADVRCFFRSPRAWWRPRWASPRCRRSRRPSKRTRRDTAARPTSPSS